MKVNIKQKKKERRLEAFIKTNSSLEYERQEGKK